MASFFELLVARADPAVIPELHACRAALEAKVAEANNEPFARALTNDQWADHFARHVEKNSVTDLVTQTQVADACLVLACLAGNSEALARFDERLRAVAPRALTGMRLERATTDDLLQDVREKLLVGNATKTPRLTTYTGRGALDGFLRVTIARAAISVLRARGSARDDEELDEKLGAETTHDPVLEELRTRYAPIISRVVSDAVRALPDPERALLRMHVEDGLTIDDLAFIYKAHRATMARRLARARNLVKDAIRERTLVEVGIAEDEFESLMGLVLSRLDVTMRRALADAPTAPPSPPSPNEEPR